MDKVAEYSGKITREFLDLTPNEDEKNCIDNEFLTLVMSLTALYVECKEEGTSKCNMKRLGEILDTVDKFNNTACPS